MSKKKYKVSFYAYETLEFDVRANDEGEAIMLASSKYEEEGAYNSTGWKLDTVILDKQKGVKNG